jgi:hypothetical protein
LETNKSLFNSGKQLKSGGRLSNQVMNYEKTQIKKELLRGSIT